jgi:hypothetical protein
VSDELARLRLDYRSAFVGYLSRRGEAQLNSAYEIGRSAILAGVGLLDLVHLHNSVTLDIVRAADGADERLDLTEAAAAFLTEVLASFEMTQRAFLERTRAERDDA